MAAPKKPRDPKLTKPTPDPGVPRSRRKPAPRPPVAGRGESPGATPQDSGPLQEPVPSVPVGVPTRYVPDVGGYHNVEPGIIRAAFEKAQEREWYRLIAWDSRGQFWRVPSRTTPGEHYIVRRRPTADKKGPWWWVLRCDCPTESAGRQVCWHKAAVVTLWRERAEEAKRK